MKRLEIIDLDGNFIIVHISDWEFPAVPPIPIPYVFPNKHVGTICKGINHLGSLDVNFYCGSDNPVDPTCFSYWYENSAEQEEDNQRRSGLMGVLYIDENPDIKNWDVESEWCVPYIKALVYACTRAYFQIDGEDLDNPIKFDEYQDWAVAGKLSQPAPSWVKDLE